MSELSKALKALEVQADWDVSEHGAELQRLESQRRAAEQSAAGERDHALALQAELRKGLSGGVAFNPERARLLRAQVGASRQRSQALAAQLQELAQLAEARREDLAAARHRAGQLQRSAREAMQAQARERASRELGLVDELWMLRSQGAAHGQ
ncbi:hypothetical protein [Eleftheria terrae]|uniref:hypothetical protein n=1 Tax=Eleftheria terrae TaxID=1597781 RepID=UPI00263B15AA|nr:hypothetical protein [Eleftheria terrae]WKB51658.1 hypothetical protein N7L95_17900 [Eleftheria terrae]